MSYKNEFIQLSKEVFQPQLETQKAKDEAYKLIDDYFSSLKESLKSEEEIAGNDLKITIETKKWEISVRNSKFSISLAGGEFTVNTLSYGHGNKDTLTFDGSNYVSRRYKTELNEELLDQYLKESFDSIIRQM